MVSKWIEASVDYDKVTGLSGISQKMDYKVERLKEIDKSEKDVSKVIDPLKHNYLHKKWSFPLRISSVNVTKSAGKCRFSHIYWRNP